MIRISAVAVCFVGVLRKALTKQHLAAVNWFAKMTHIKYFFHGYGLLSRILYDEKLSDAKSKAALYH